MKDLAEGQGDQQAPLLPPGPGPSLSPPSPVLLCQLHHHGRQLVEHKDARKPLVAQQPIGDLLMSGHRKLICPQHLEQEGNLGQGQVYDLTPNCPSTSVPVLSVLYCLSVVEERMSPHNGNEHCKVWGPPKCPLPA